MRREFAIDSGARVKGARYREALQTTGCNMTGL
jgi:hypothetical protein